MSDNISSKLLIKFFLLIFLSTIIIGSVSLLYPFGRDQGIYAYIAKLILNGKIDYKYSYNLRPPGIHYTFVLGQVLFGKSMIGMRVFDLIWQVCTAFVIFLIMIKLTNSRFASLISSLLYVFMYYRLDYWHTLQTEGFMNLPLSISVLLILLERENKFWLFFLSGIFFSFAFLYKFTIASFIVLLMICIAFNNEEINSKLKRIFSFSVGFLIILLMVAFYYYFNDALKEMVEIQFIQIPMYAKIGFETETSSFIISNLLRLFFYSVYSPLIFLTILLMVYLIRLKLILYQNIILLIWFITAFISLIGQWKFFIYHFLIIIPPIIICSIYLITLYLERIQLKYRKRLMFLTAVFFLFFLLIAAKPFYPRIIDNYKYLKGDYSLEDAYLKNGTTIDSVFTTKKVFAVTDFIEQKTSIQDGIYIWGIEPLIYYLSGRECVSRFTYNTPLYWRGDNSSYQKEFLSQLHQHNPKLILVAKRDPMYNITGFHEDSDRMLEKFVEFKGIIDSNYTYKTEVQEFKIYELRRQF